MNDPLLDGVGSSSSGGSGGGEGRRVHLFTRRTDAIAHGSRYQKAAALVDLAEDGIGLPVQILDQSNFESVAKIYFFFIQLDIIWSLNLFALILLNFFEKPLWCAKYSADACSEREYFFLGQLPYLTNKESFVYESITLTILAIQIIFPISYEGYRIYTRNPVNHIKRETGMEMIKRKSWP